MKPVRLWCLALAFAALLPPTVSAQTLTAADAILRIQQHYAVPPPSNTVDTVKAGDPSTPVTGIAVTFLDTMEVLREASQRGLNLVITHEPTFYSHLDDTTFFVQDPVYLEKLAFIQQHHLVVFRFHDQMHEITPDPIAMGLIQALGWQSYRDAGSPFLLTIPRTTLLELSRDLAKKLNTQTLRVVGNPSLQSRTSPFFPGLSGRKSKFSRCVRMKSKSCSWAKCLSGRR